MKYQIGDKVILKRIFPWPDTLLTVVKLLPSRHEVCLQAAHKGAGIWVTHENNRQISLAISPD